MEFQRRWAEAQRELWDTETSCNPSCQASPHTLSYAEAHNTMEFQKRWAEAQKELRGTQALGSSTPLPVEPSAPQPLSNPEAHASAPCPARPSQHPECLPGVKRPRDPNQSTNAIRTPKWLRIRRPLRPLALSELQHVDLSTCADQRAPSPSVSQPLCLQTPGPCDAHRAFVSSSADSECLGSACPQIPSSEIPEDVHQIQSQGVTQTPQEKTSYSQAASQELSLSDHSSKLCPSLSMASPWPSPRHPMTQSLCCSGPHSLEHPEPPPPVLSFATTTDGTHPCIKQATSVTSEKVGDQHGKIAQDMDMAEVEDHSLTIQATQASPAPSCTPSQFLGPAGTAPSLASQGMCTTWLTADLARVEAEQFNEANLERSLELGHGSAKQLGADSWKISAWETALMVRRAMKAAQSEVQNVDHESLKRLRETENGHCVTRALQRSLKKHKRCPSPSTCACWEVLKGQGLVKPAERDSGQKTRCRARDTNRLI